MAFFQAPPELGNQLDADVLLNEWLENQLPPDLLQEERRRFSELGALAGGELYRLQLADRLNEPVHTAYDPWGHRVDVVEETAVWKRARVIAAEYGLVGAGYTGTYGHLDRVIQFARNYLVQASLDVYACPLAMTDGAARTLLDVGPEDLVARAVPRLTSHDPDFMWTSGQWMTERTGGSDVGRSETEARPTADPEKFTLHGTKWFTSAVSADMALTLARPTGNPEGGRGLALFFVELRDAKGRLEGIQVNRLKDKLGTRKVPTAELTLDGCPARAVHGTTSGIRNIASMLNVTRTWNAVSSAFFARRATALATDYARRRFAFGHALADKPLHIDTMAGLTAETEACFHLAFAVVRLMGRVEHGGDETAKSLLRLLTPVAKLTTAKQAVSVCSEGIEAFGGAGYVEDTGLPTLLRDAQVLPIWEGTTNVLSLDTLKAAAASGAGEAVLEWFDTLIAGAEGTELEGAAQVASRGAERASTWLRRVQSQAPEVAEAGARRFATTLGRSLQLALMVEHARLRLERGDGARACAVARRFARHGVDAFGPEEPSSEDTRLIMEAAR